MKRLTLIMAAILAISLSVFGKDIKGRILDAKEILWNLQMLSFCKIQHLLQE